jgi:predicted enzyme related to lactoylglutathione lyase
MLKKAIPVLPADNITKTIDFFEAKLGFTATNYGNYAILKYKNAEIHLLMRTAKSARTVGGCLIMVENIEDLYTRFCAKGLIGLRGKLTGRPWGIKEFTIEDNNQNLIRFGEKR